MCFPASTRNINKMYSCKIANIAFKSAIIMENSVFKISPFPVGSLGEGKTNEQQSEIRSNQKC